MQCPVKRLLPRVGLHRTPVHETCHGDEHVGVPEVKWTCSSSLWFDRRLKNLLPTPLKSQDTIAPWEVRARSLINLFLESPCRRPQPWPPASHTCILLTIIDWMKASEARVLTSILIILKWSYIKRVKWGLCLPRNVNLFIKVCLGWFRVVYNSIALVRDWIRFCICFVYLFAFFLILLDLFIFSPGVSTLCVWYKVVFWVKCLWVCGCPFLAVRKYWWIPW